MGIKRTGKSTDLVVVAQGQFYGGSANFTAANYPLFAALIFAQRARCAAAIRFLPAADILRLGRAVLFCAAFCPLVGVVGVPSNNRTT